jgi:hypothetical protein
MADQGDEGKASWRSALWAFIRSKTSVGLSLSSRVLMREVGEFF